MAKPFGKVRSMAQLQVPALRAAVQAAPPPAPAEPKHEFGVKEWERLPFQAEVVTAKLGRPMTRREFADMQDSQKYETKLTPSEELHFQQWKHKYAPDDSGFDYDLRGAFLDGLKPDGKTGHWDDKFKKPNHPTFSIYSKYAPYRPDLAGTWKGDKYIPPNPDIKQDFLHNLAVKLGLADDRPPSAPVTKAQPLSSYPTEADALQAEKAGYGYGDPNEGVLQLQRIMGLGGNPAGVPTDENAMTTIGLLRALAGDSLETFQVPSDSSTGNAMLRASLAANRSPITGYGFDPRRAVADVVDSHLNKLGLYSGKEDQAFYVGQVEFGGVKEPPGSVLVHEMTHRGINKLRKMPDAPQWPAGLIEEDVVRYTMFKHAGDPEQAGETRTSVKAKAIEAIEGNKEYSNFITNFENFAAQKIAERRRGGPR